MEKILIIASAVCMVASAAIGFMKRSEFISVRKDKDGFNQQIQTIFNDLEKFKDSMSNTQQEYTKVSAQKAEADSEIEFQRAEITRLDSAMKTVKADQETISSELKDAEDTLGELSKLLAELGEGSNFTPDQIPQIIDSLKADKRQLEEDAQSLTAEMGVLRKNLDGNEAWLSSYDERRQRRAVRVARNSLEATITAVNNDYGVVVLRAGKEQGVDSESKLIIKRGPNVVGALNIVSVEPNLTVASIDQDSVSKDTVVLPGDRVFFADLQK